MKTAIRQITTGTFIAFIIITGNAKADGAETKVSSQEIIETELKLESWMTNDQIWDVNSVFNIDFAEEPELELELKGWMTSDHVWHHQEKTKEKSLTLENWK